MQCPRCGEAVVAGQEYCLGCGSRLSGVARLGPVPASRRTLLVPVLVALVVAAVGAGAAIALTRESATQSAIVTATGGSSTVPASATGEPTLVDWPAGTSGWTTVLASVPKVDGRDVALARAAQARERGLEQVGLLDSSRFASLHPGYWIVFASQAEATSQLRDARAVQRGARVARISR